MERINDIGERAVTLFGPTLEIEALMYVEDIAGIGGKTQMEKLIKNARQLEKKKKADSEPG